MNEYRYKNRQYIYKRTKRNVDNAERTKEERRHIGRKWDKKENNCMRIERKRR